MNHFAPLNLAYFLCAAVNGVLGWRIRFAPAGSRKSGKFWLGVSLVLLILGVIRMLKVQLVIGDFGRREAMEAGIYEDRRDLQLGVILIMAALCVLGIGMMRSRIGSRSLTKWIASSGLVCLTFLTAARALSYHYLDALFGAVVVGPLTVGGVVDGSIIVVLSGQAVWLLGKHTSYIRNTSNQVRVQPSNSGF
ncbi:MAG TPA: hypothetical protein VHD56_07970 [Tepidisphaeraceae bacterium]|nr:hypothetical protein [Tepidisphaeraceae bacterium]